MPQAQAPPVVGCGVRVSAVHKTPRCVVARGAQWSCIRKWHSLPTRNRNVVSVGPVLVGKFTEQQKKHATFRADVCLGERPPRPCGLYAAILMTSYTHHTHTPTHTNSTHMHICPHTHKHTQHSHRATHTHTERETCTQTHTISTHIHTCMPSKFIHPNTRTYNTHTQTKCMHTDTVHIARTCTHACIHANTHTHAQYTTILLTHMHTDTVHDPPHRHAHIQTHTYILI